MITQGQRSFLLMFAEMLELNPDIRMGQLFCHLVDIAGIDERANIYDVEDDDLNAAACRHLEGMRLREPPEPLSKVLPLAKSA